MKIETKYDVSNILWASYWPETRKIVALPVKVRSIQLTVFPEHKKLYYFCDEVPPPDWDYELVNNRVFEESELFETEKEATEYSLTRNWERKNNEQ